MALPLALLVLAAATGADPVVEALRLPVQTFTLDNGIEVAVHPDPIQQLVAVHLLVRAGSADDPPGAEGTAHLVEHLLGSTGAGREAVLGALGARANAWTDPDWTAFHAVVPPGAVNLALDLEAGYLAGFPSTLDPEVLAREAAVVRMEAAQDAASARGDDARVLASLLWPARHPYAHPVLGPPTGEGDPWSLASVGAFYQSRYAPSDLTLVLAGAVELEAARDLARRTLGALPARAPGARAQADPPPLDREIRAAHLADVADRTLYVAWRTAPAGHADGPALEVAARLLAGGRGGRLDEPLVHRTAAARRVAAWADARPQGSAFGIRIQAEEGVPLAEILEVVDREVLRLAASGPSEAEMVRVRGALRGAWLRAVEPIDDRAALLGRCLAESGDPDCLAVGLDARLAVTSDDVRRVVDTWLPLDRRILLCVVPASEPHAALPGSERVATPALRQAAPVRLAPAEPERPSYEGEPFVPRLPRVEERLLPAGGRLLMVRRPGLPLVRIEATVLHDGFPVDEALRLAGALLDNGTRRRDAGRLAADLDRMGAVLETGTGPSGPWVAVEAPSDAVSPALDLLSEVLLHPVFPAREVRRVAGAWRTDVANALRSPGRILAAAEVRAIYPADHPLGTLADARDPHRWTRARVGRAWHDALRHGRLLVVAAGDLEASTLLPQVSARLGGVGGDRISSSVPAPPEPVQGPRVVLVDDPGSSEARIVLSLPAPGRGDPDLLCARLVAWMLGGGFDSRLHRRLREAEGLVYAVQATVHAWPGHGRIRVLTRTSADRAARVARLLVDEVGRLGSPEGLPASEIAAARASILRGEAETAGTLAGLAGRLGEEAAVGGGRDTWERDVRRIAEADPTSVRASARRICRPEAAVLVILADRDLVEPALEAEEVFPTDLWSARRALEGAPSSPAAGLPAM
ncbi:MAG: insulinase family protein [Deltaproteobacteria bacterium]|nr:insulinase family protein [Deltaproteobacteria bacterium]